MNQFIKSKTLTPVMNKQYSNTVLYQPPQISAKSLKDLEDFRNRIREPTIDFVFPDPKTGSMLNKTEDDLKDILSNMAMEQSGNVKLYKTVNNYRNKLKKPECTSLVFINGVFAFSGYPYSIEMTPKSLEKPLDFDIVSKCRFFEANEGTVLRVFNVNGEWYTITNKKLNAFTCKWASKEKTFGCHLAKSIFALLNPNYTDDGSCAKPRFDDVNISTEYVNKIWSESLDPTKRYFFLLKCNEEERVVCDAEEAILNIGVIDENNQLSLDKEVKLANVYQSEFSVVPSYTIPKPTEHKFSNLCELVEKVNNIDHTKCSGLLAICKTDSSGADIEANIEHHIHFKLLKPKYHYLNSLRGNTPSIRFRFFQLRYLGNLDLQLKHCIEDFKNLYPDYCKGAEKSISKIATKIHSLYQKIFVSKTESIDIQDQEMKKILYTIHKEFLTTRQSTTYQKVNDILSYITPEQLNGLIKEHETKKNRVYTDPVEAEKIN